MRKAFLRAVGAGGVMAAMAASVALAQPAGVKNQDVGGPTLAGSYKVQDGKITIVGGGADIWNSADQFHYAYVFATGDFDYVVKVESLEGPDGWTKAELMARDVDEALFGGPDGGDRFIASMTTRSGGQNEIGLQWRSDTRSGGCAWPNDIGITTPLARPTYPNTWLRLERIGDKFWGHTSSDGVAWTVLRGSPYDFASTNGNEAAPRTDGVMPAKLAIGLAVTAHNDTDTTGGVAVFSEWKAVTQVPIAITTQPPATLAVSANNTLTLSVAATGDPIHYQWQKGGVDIAGATSPTYSKALAQVDDSGTYTVKLFRSGQEVVSSPCVVSVTVDTTAPTVVAVKPLSSLTTVKVTFSEPVKAPTATTPSNYQFTGGVTTTAAVLSADAFSVTLTTTAQTANTPYTLTVVNVQDTANNPVPAGSAMAFTSVDLLTGYALYERWDDANGDLGDLTAFGTALDDGSARAPDISAVVNQFGGPWGAADNYNSRVRTFFTPPSSGNYVFFVSADDGANVYLSTDDKPANKKLIANESGWSNQYQWTNAGSGALESKRSDQFAGTEWPGFDIITLVGGQKYYMEIRQNEGGGGDGSDVTFIKAGTADPSNDAAGMFMKGDVISWYETRDVLPPVIDTHPADNVTIDAGGTATLSVVAHNPGAGALSYQWQKNGRDIAGATSADYVISNAGPLDIGQYWVKVTNKAGTVTSGQGSPNPTVVMVKATGVYTIEAEDFDNGGVSKPEVSVMPYLGNAYTNLGAVYDVDYHNTDALDSTTYRTGLPTGQNANTSENNGGQWGLTRAGEWNMSVNFKVGWVGAGDWGNYTRTFPTPAKDYYVFWASSYDGVSAGQINGALGFVTAGVGTTSQTVTNVGTFDSVGSGDWSRNNLVAMTDGVGGPVKTLSLGGTKTFRWTYNSGDADYLLFIPATSTPTGPKIDAISIATGGKIKITWTGAATLQSSTTLPATSWTDVTGAVSGGELTPPASGAIYYRLKQ